MLRKDNIHFVAVTCHRTRIPTSDRKCATSTIAIYFVSSYFSNIFPDIQAYIQAYILTLT